MDNSPCPDNAIIPKIEGFFRFITDIIRQDSFQTFYKLGIDKGEICRYDNNQEN